MTAVRSASLLLCSPQQVAVSPGERCKMCTCVFADGATKFALAAHLRRCRLRGSASRLVGAATDRRLQEVVWRPPCGLQNATCKFWHCQALWLGMHAAGHVLQESARRRACSQLQHVCSGAESTCMSSLVISVVRTRTAADKTLQLHKQGKSMGQQVTVLQADRAPRPRRSAASRRGNAQIALALRRGAALAQTAGSCHTPSTR